MLQPFGSSNSSKILSGFIIYTPHTPAHVVFCRLKEFVSCAFLVFGETYMFQIIKEPLSLTDQDPFTEGKELFQTYITLKKK